MSALWIGLTAASTAAATSRALQPVQQQSSSSCCWFDPTCESSSCMLVCNSRLVWQQQSRSSCSPHVTTCSQLTDGALDGGSSSSSSRCELADNCQLHSQ
jgi:hypothetical protein